MRGLAYYNEIDPYAAQWLRNLIAAGHIAPGIVDERSIVDVRPSDLFGFTQCHFFAGIGVWSYALRRAGWPDDRPVWTGSCPCQPFSAAGAGGGFDDERHLWPHWHHLIRVCRPPHVFGEQVASKDGLGWLDLVQSDMEGEGYALWPVDLCAAGVGAPHIRQRLWFVGQDELGNTYRDAVERHAGGRLGTQAGVAGLGDEHRRLSNGHRTAGAVGLVADNHDDGLRATWHVGRDQSERDLEPRWATGRLDHGDDAGSQGHAGHGGGVGGRALALGSTAAPSLSSWLEHGSGDGRLERGTEPSGRSASTGRGLGRLGDHRSGRREVARLNAGGFGSADREREAGQLGVPGASGGSLRAGPTNGHWKAADWLFCRDGRWRPVEPESFPLAHGAASRVGRLRAYGNAIVAQAAEEVIATFLDHEQDDCPDDRGACLSVGDILG